MKNLSSKKKSIKLALQFLYSLKISQSSINKTKFNILKEKNKEKIDVLYFDSIVYVFNKEQKFLDHIIKNYIKNDFVVNIIDEIILKIAIIELIFLKKIEMSMMVNEIIDLTKKFSTKNSYIFIYKIINIITKISMLNKNLF